MRLLRLGSSFSEMSTFLIAGGRGAYDSLKRRLGVPLCDALQHGWSLWFPLKQPQKELES